MLVLSRKIGEQVVFPTLGVTIKVVAIRGDKVRLAFTAPPDVPIHRREVFDDIQREDPMRVETRKRSTAA